MDIPEIKSLLGNEDSQLRLRGLVALKDYPPETAVPLLIAQRQDNVFLVRSFVAMGLGRKRNEEAYAALLEMLETEPDHNVQAEIANSLGLYGPQAVERLVALFEESHHWLVRRSILAIMPELDHPYELLTIALKALQDKDQTIVQSGIATLGLLANTPESESALATLIMRSQSQHWRSRLAAAYALRAFDSKAAHTALAQLRQDSHHKVVAAALEGLLPQ